MVFERGFFGYGYGGGELGLALQRLEDYGVFTYLLPFILVFAIVYGILEKSKVLGENKGIMLVISLAIGGLSLYWGITSEFFTIIFPQLGIGLSILIASLILIGLFVPFEKDGTSFGWGNYIFLGIGGLIFVIIVMNSLVISERYGLGGFGWFGSYWWQQYWPVIIVLIIFVGLIVAVMTGGRRREPVEEEIRRRR